MSHPFLTINEVHDAYRSKKASVKEITTEFLSRIEKSRLNAYLTVSKERALAQAEQLDRELTVKSFDVLVKEKPLFGIPLGIKDIFTIDQVRTTAASKILENYVPPYTATCVARLETAGAISLGKLNMDEFAMGSTNENSAYGKVEHPTHPGYVPGGSSGGSAAAVKAGLCVAALGTDTGGSIRLPASFCGIVGVKPTYGRVSRYGMIAFASSLDQAGPMTNSVLDSARILKVMSGEDSYDSTSAPIAVPSSLDALSKVSLSGKKIGIPKEYFGAGLSDSVRTAIDAALSTLKKAGAEVVEVSLPHTKYAVATYYLVASSEASSNLSRFDGIRYGVRPKEAVEATSPLEFYKKVRVNFGPEVKRRILLGTFALSSGYYDAYYQKANQVRRLIQNDFLSAFAKCDFIASPVATTTAFKIGEKQDPLSAYLSDLLTIPASLAGLPALSLPCGKDSNGLSIGLQLIGKHFDETALLGLAFTAESLFNEGAK